MKDTKQKAISFGKIINVFAWLSLLLAILTSALTVFASLSGEENGKEIFGYKMLIVTSDSMSKSPISENEAIFFNSGDLIFIESIDDYKALSVGDVITFISYNPQSYGKTVTHKIREIRYTISKEISGYVTYGINTGINDTTIVKPENIIGKYSFKIPKIGNIFSFLKTSGGYYLSVLIPAVLLIIFFSIKVGKILGKKEDVMIYNEGIEKLEKRVTELEKFKKIISVEHERESKPITKITGRSKTLREKRNSTADILNQIKAEDMAFKFFPRDRKNF